MLELFLISCSQHGLYATMYGGVAGARLCRVMFRFGKQGPYGVAASFALAVQVHT